jgi:hypothetical protein
MDQYEIWRAFNSVPNDYVYGYYFIKPLNT